MSISRTSSVFSSSVIEYLYRLMHSNCVVIVGLISGVDLSRISRQVCCIVLFTEFGKSVGHQTLKLLNMCGFFVFFRSNHLYFSELRRLLYICCYCFQVFKSWVMTGVVDERREMKLWELCYTYRYAYIIYRAEEFPVIDCRRVDE